MGDVLGGRWEIVRALGEGGQAHTFLVQDSNSDSKTHFVLKRLKNPNRLDRFAIEVEAVRTLDHPNILHLIDFDLENEPYFLVTEYCEAGSLDKSKPI